MKCSLFARIVPCAAGLLLFCAGGAAWAAGQGPATETPASESAASDGFSMTQTSRRHHALPELDTGRADAAARDSATQVRLLSVSADTPAGHPITVVASSGADLRIVEFDSGSKSEAGSVSHAPAILPPLQGNYAALPAVRSRSMESTPPGRLRPVAAETGFGRFQSLLFGPPAMAHPARLAARPASGESGSAAKSVPAVRERPFFISEVRHEFVQPPRPIVASQSPREVSVLIRPQSGQF